MPRSVNFTDKSTLKNPTQKNIDCRENCGKRKLLIALITDQCCSGSHANRTLPRVTLASVSREGQRGVSF